MIFYFTASGNSFDVARIIARATNDEMIDLGSAYKTDRFGLRFRVSQGENLGFVFPVYAWSTPAIVDDFIREVQFITDNGRPYRPGYAYCVMTYGLMAGNTAKFFEKQLKKHQNIQLDASFAVKGVGTCVYIYDMPTPEKQEHIIRGMRRDAKQVATAIKEMRMGHFENRNPAGQVLSAFTGRENKKNSIKPFFVDDDRCIGCATCATVCPTNTIVMQRGRPMWVGDACTQCLACLHRCPTQATQYGPLTAKRRRYLNPALNLGARSTDDPTAETDVTGRDFLIPEL